MKRFIIVTALTALIMCNAAAQSAAFLRYAPNPDLDVAYIEGFRIDDSTVFDVTVILIKDSATMAWLINDLHLNKYNEKIFSKKNPIHYFLFNVSPDDPSKRIKNPRYVKHDIMIFTPHHKRITIYHNIDNNLLDNIFNHMSKEIKKHIQKK